MNQILIHTLSGTKLRAGAVITALAMLLGSAAAPALGAQGNLATRVDRAPEGLVQFSFPVRAGVCGNGRTFLTIDGSMHYGTFFNTSDPRMAEECEPGPVRVVIERAGQRVLALRTFVGPADTAAPPATDLGTVPASEAAGYLLRLAATLDGRPGRDAIMPAALASGVDASPQLLAIARDGARPAETRRTALSWLARESDSPEAAARTASALVQLARDPAPPRTVRQQALSVLTRLSSGAGIPHVIALSRSTDDPWLSETAVSAIARSGDPRAREALREIVRSASLPDPALVIAVRGLGGSYATAADAALLRSAFGRFTGERPRAGIISALASVGGAQNVDWLIGVARDADVPASLRRSALMGARRAGASSVQLARVYGAGDNALRRVVVSALAASPDEAAVDKLLAIARSGDDRVVRRSAIAALTKVDDPRVKAALAEIVER